MRRLVIVLVLCTAWGKVVADELSINGFVMNYSSLSPHGHEELFRRNWLRLDLEFSQDLANFYASLDFINENPVGTHLLEENLKEAYIDFSLGPVDWRVGKQQFAWGKADGTLITDIVNPFDLRRSFLVFDYGDMRIGLNAVKATYYLGDHGLEMIWISSFVPLQFGPPGSPWAPSLPDTGIPITEIKDPEMPENTLANSEVGGRFLTNIANFDVTLNYLYIFDDIPLFEKKIGVDAEANPFMEISPRFHRVHTVGYNLENVFGSFVVRSEGAIFFNRAFDTQDPAQEGLYVEKNHLNYMVGFDARVNSDWAFYGQIIQSLILAYDEAMLEDQVQISLTGRLDGDLLDNTLKPTFFVFYSFHGGDVWFWPELTYQIQDGLTGAVGLHLFEGDPDTLFGAFDRNDYFYFQIQYSF